MSQTKLMWNSCWYEKDHMPLWPKYLYACITSLQKCIWYPEEMSPAELSLKCISLYHQLLTTYSFRLNAPCNWNICLQCILVRVAFLYIAFFDFTKQLVSLIPLRCQFLLFFVLNSRLFLRNICFHCMACNLLSQFLEIQILENQPTSCLQN